MKAKRTTFKAHYHPAFKALFTPWGFDIDDPPDRYVVLEGSEEFDQLQARFLKQLAIVRAQCVPKKGGAR